MCREAALRDIEWHLRLALAIPGIALAMPAALHAQPIPGALPESAKALSQGEWPAYAGTYAAARYSPLTQVNRDNAKNLRVAWRWKSPDAAVRAAKPEIGPSLANESTPLMVGGVLYTSTSCRRSPRSMPRAARPNGCSTRKSTTMASACQPTMAGCIAASPIGATATTNALSC
jgi:hypothetical protein